MMHRHVVSDATAARSELPAERARPLRREGRHSFPFHELSPDEFEVFCFLLLLKEHPGGSIYYFGKTKDAGRDIIHKVGGRVRLIQCKRYTQKVGIGEVRPELAKLCANVFTDRLPEPIDEVVFYIAPDVTADAADLIQQRSRWHREADAGFKEHLGEPATPELLTFARSWWPEPDYVTALSLTERAKKFPDLCDEFFGTQKVIDGSLDDVRQVVRDEMSPIRLLLDLRLPHQTRQLGVATDVCGNSLDRRAILEAFNTASGPLLCWPTTLGDGRWLPRGEGDRIAERIASEASSTTLVLGPPGSGKSALLARVGTRCSDDGHAVLAIKADLLGEGADSPATLAEQLRLPAEVSTCVRELTAASRVVVLVDQLDALADLVDLRSGRLNALLQLIKQLSGVENVHVVASCRAFEHGHDVRLTSIEAEAVVLEPLAWEAVAEVFQSRGVVATHWPHEFRELLRTPQHLKIFLDRLQGGAEDRIFTSYQQLLDDLWARRVLNDDGPEGRPRLLTDVAERMAERETLWVPLARYEDRLPLVEALEAADILSRSANGFSVGFRHQTLFEHARARAFAQGQGSSLADHVLDRQDGLFVRPLLWSSLNYLRGADPGGYEGEMGRLWNEPVRKHLRHLLIDFLGQASTPGPNEVEERWLLQYLRKPEYRAKVMAAVRGNPAWFSILAPSHLPAIMGLPAREAWPAVWVIGAAWGFDRARCLALIEENWLPDPANDELAWRTLEQLPSWDDPALSVACRLIRRTDIGLPAVGLLASRVGEGAPVLAVRLLAEKFLTDLERLEAMPDPAPEPLPEGADEGERIAHACSHRPWERFEPLLTRRDGLYDLEELAEAAPAEFLSQVWPWFLRVVERLSIGTDRHVATYRRDHSLASWMRGEEDGGHYPVVAAVEAAIRRLAESNPEQFLSFLDREQGHDSMVVQRLLGRGLLALLPTHPADVLRFLCADPRRLALGSFDDEYGDTCALIAGVAPALDQTQIALLESCILAWERYRPDEGAMTADQRFRTARWVRKHRLRLLCAIPEARRSATTQSLISTEAVVFPDHAEAGVHRVESGFVGSPMSAQQMQRAKDEDIVNLFAVLREPESRRLRHFLVGGMDEAASEFGTFAKECPERAVAIIRQCPPGGQDQPVAEALVPLSESGFGTEALYALVCELEGRGFQSREFRVSAARAFANRAAPKVGLPEPVCATLERWLDAGWEEEPVPQPRTQDAERTPGSLFWRMGGMFPLPFGAYDLLRALTVGYLLREPAATGRWLAILESHIERHAGTSTWLAMANDLRALRLCGHDRATQFLLRLFDRVPQLLGDVRGAVLLTHAWWFLPPQNTHRLLRQIRDGGWAQGPQAFGELLTLRRLHFPQDDEARRALEDALAPSAAPTALLQGVRLGLAFAAANLWGEAEHHAAATGILTRLVPLATEAMHPAIMGAFGTVEVLCVDDATLALLRALLEHPAVMTPADSGFLVERLQDLLSSEPDLVHDLASELVRLRAAELADTRTALAAYTSHLTNIALTLQRLGGVHRSRGLDLFERLLDLGVHDAQAMLNELDRRPLNLQPAPRRPRRRARRRRRR